MTGPSLPGFADTWLVIAAGALGLWPMRALGIVTWFTARRNLGF
ncbi:hypothetical protein [Corynebacterium variabile]|nr:hypothetical protein [Corynebacterium variabile]